METKKENSSDFLKQELDSMHRKSYLKIFLVTLIFAALVFGGIVLGLKLSGKIEKKGSNSNVELILPSPEATPIPTPTPETPAATPTPGAAATPAPVAGNSETYAVQSGDTIGSLAQKFSVTESEIASLNGLADPYTIYEGDTLKIPKK